MQPSETSGKSLSREASPDRPIAQPPRRRAACESCHSSKVRCTGGQPCARCNASNLTCVYKLASRIGKPKGSKNKSTLRRLQLEAEQAAQLNAEQSSLPYHAFPQSTGANSEGDFLFGLPHGDASAGYQDSLLSDFAMPGHSWDWNLEQSNWLGGLELPAGPPAPYGPQVSTAETGWMIGTYLGNSNYLASLTNEASYDDATLDGPNTALFDDLRIDSTSDSQSPLPSITSGSSHASSPWGVRPAGLTDGGWEYFHQNQLPMMPGHTLPTTQFCHCADKLSNELLMFRHPDALHLATNSAEAFLRNSEQLLQALLVFLTCQTCERNPKRLGLMMTVFATFVQHFAALATHNSGTPVHSPFPNPPSGVTSYLEANSQRYLEGYAPEESSIRALVLQQTAQRWREACCKAVNLLQTTHTRTEQESNLLLSGLGLGMDTGSGQGGHMSWGQEDTEACARGLSRVDSQLAVFTWEGREALVHLQAQNP